jgi:tRNA threonylcarbamoyl adenosine modification protein YeaZ
MNILAFDTCLGALSVAARWRGPGGEWLMRHAREVRDKGHAERLLPMIDEVMQEAGLAFSDIGRIAVTVGPGSFTGVRVGVAAARGLALASGIATVGATSLAVMAHQADELLGQARRGRLLAVAVDARRGSVYLQVFGEAQDAAAAPRLLAVDDAAGQIGTRPTIIVGSGAAMVAGAVRAAGGQAEATLPALQPDARSLALLAADLAPAHPLRTLYLRPPDVKPQADRSLTRASP